VTARNDPALYEDKPRYNPDRNTFRVDGHVDFDGVQHWGVSVIRQIHAERLCRGRGYCSIHNPSVHHMNDWPYIWRSDETQMERLCPHDVAHPDPDDLKYWVEEANAPWKAVHECDGCCNLGGP
jgi:hypothetical protein